MKLQVIKNKVLYTLRWITIYTLYCAFILTVASFFILQLPWVQTRLTRQILESVTEQTGFKASIGRLEFYWFDRLNINNLSITDPENNDMFNIGSLRLNFTFSGLLQGNGYALDAALVDSATVHLATIKENDSVNNLNINVFVHRLMPRSGKKPARAPAITIGEVLLKNSAFIYASNSDSITQGFDYNHFRVNIAGAEVQQLFIQDDTVSMQVQSLQATEAKTRLSIQQLQTFFRFSDRGLEFHGIELQAGKSYIADTVLFRFSGQDDLSDFADSVWAEIHLKEAVIHPEDLALFAPGTEKLLQPVRLNGNLIGKISDFTFRNMQLNTGNTRLTGELSMEGLPDLEETFIVAELSHSEIDPNDLSFLFTPETLEQLNNLGRVSFKGQFLGYPNDFVANGEFAGGIGRIRSDINLKINEANPALSAYSGRLSLDKFNLGIFFRDTLLFQQVTMDGSVNGKGLTLESADLYLKGTINTLGVMGYTYTGITTNARFANQLFAGTLAVLDPNLTLRIDGTIDLRNNRQHVQLQGTLDSARLEYLNLSRDALHLSSIIDLDTYGLTLDSLRGTAHLKNLTVFYKDEKHNFGELSLTASHNNQTRQLILQTTSVNAQVSGNFNFSDLLGDTEELLHEFWLTIRNNRENLETYYQAKNKTPRTYAAAFEVLLKDLNPLFNLLDIPLRLTRNTLITGSFIHGPIVSIRAFTRSDSIFYRSSAFCRNEVEISASKSYSGTEALAMVYVKSDKQVMKKNLTTGPFTAEAIWDGNHIDLDLGLSQPPENKIRINAIVDFKDSTYIRFKPSEIVLLNSAWSFNAGNYIAISGREWRVHNVVIQQPNQSIAFRGSLSADSSRALQLVLSNVSLEFLSGLARRKLEGTLSGNVRLVNLYHKPSVENTLSISDLRVNDFLIGNITGNNHWNSDSRRFEMQFYIDRSGSRIVDFNGYYTPSDNINPLNGKAILNRASLKMVEPFLEDLFSRMQGEISGTCQVTGTLANPMLNGSASITNGELTVNYLKTSYRFSGNMGFSPTAITLSDFNLTDVLNNRARLQGQIKHQAFANMQLNLSASFADFQVLNTSQRDNDLFYGQAYASGDAAITGPVNNLSLTVNAITRKNTRIFIPIGGTTVSQQKDFISFVNFTQTDSAQAAHSGESKRVQLAGFNMEFNLEVTPDAYSEIIFDIKAGDIIRGRGNGKLRLQMNTDGEFTMFGPIEFTEGWYNFTLHNIINKEFQIKPGSRITWYGDPYQAVLDINASYNQLASLGPILNDPTLANSAALKRKYPVEVLLKLEGPMLSPQINFDIEARDLPKSVAVEGRPPVALDLEFYSFKSRMDEQELKKQVFSLIVLRRFTPPESFSMSGSVTNSVSELLSNQLSYWMSQVDENLEIDVNLGAMDQEAFNTFQLRLSYTLLNGRMRITGDGTFNNQNASVSGTGGQPGTFSSLAGDWTIDYLLTPDGRFKVKMYSRTNANQNTTALNNQNTITTGVSLTYTQNFNAVKELLRSAHERQRREQSPAPPDSAARKEDED